jgi:deoxycytidylate deaminase
LVELPFDFGTSQQVAQVDHPEDWDKLVRSSCPLGLTRTRLLHQRATQTLLKAGRHVVAFGYAKQISTKDQLLSK